MASDLKYYADERRRYLVEAETPMSIEAMNVVSAALCRELGYDPCVVKLNPRRRNWSVFFHRRARYTDAKTFVNPRGIRAAEPYIDMGTEMMNLRVFLHELAHYIHACDYNSRYVKAGGNVPQNRMRREQWHGPEHRAIMADLVARYHKQRGTTVEKKEELLAAGA